LLGNHDREGNATVGCDLAKCGTVYVFKSERDRTNPESEEAPRGGPQMGQNDGDESDGENSPSAVESEHDQRPSEQVRNHIGHIENVKALQALEKPAEDASRKPDRHGSATISRSQRAVDANSGGTWNRRSTCEAITRVTSMLSTPMQL